MPNLKQKRAISKVVENGGNVGKAIKEAYSESMALLMTLWALPEGHLLRF